mgnify:FL=1
MKKIVLSALVLTFLACGEQKSKQETVTVNQEATEQTKAEYPSAARKAEFENAEIAQIYDDYNLLKTALVNTNSQKAQAAAKTLEESMQVSELELGFTEAVQKISSEEDVNVQREYFEAVTAGVKAIVEEHITSGTLYYQYCPMAFEGKGAYWISNEKEVFNPYFGDVMLHCGTVDAEIN